MFIALIISLLLTTRIKDKTAGRIFIIWVLAIILDLIISWFLGFVFPAMAITVATREDMIYVGGLRVIGALIGVLIGYIFMPLVEWLDELGK